MKHLWKWTSSLLFQKDNSCSIFRTAFEQWERERPILAKNYKFIITCIMFQCIHNLAANLARFVHITQTPLYDLGFAIVPPLNPKYDFACDLVFSICTVITVVVWLSPFFDRKSIIFSTGILARFLGVLVLAQSLRILTFVMTDLPGPSPRCNIEPKRYDERLTTNDISLSSLLGMFSRGCGELVFSSRMMLVVLFLLTIKKYGGKKIFLGIFVVLALLYSFLLIAARREYTLSIFMAWYVVPLLWIAYGKKFPDDGIEPANFMKQQKSELKHTKL